MHISIYYIINKIFNEDIGLNFENFQYYYQENDNVIYFDAILAGDKYTFSITTVKESNIKVYTNYNDGGFAEFYGLKCYIDPRAEVFKKSVGKLSEEKGRYDEYLLYTKVAELATELISEKRKI